VVNLAAAIGGWICNPIVPIYRDAEIVGMLGDCQSCLLFVPGLWRGIDYLAMAQRVADRLPGLEHIVTVRADSSPQRYESWLDKVCDPISSWPEVGADEIKLVMYTSGTTGPAKGVLHSHATLPVAVERAFRNWSVGKGDCILMPSPVTHATGYCVGLELPFSIGTTTLLMERWDAASAAELIRVYGVKATVGATPLLQELLDHTSPDDPLPLQVFACGGASVPPDLIRRADREIRGFACRVYGASEAPLVTGGRTAADSESIGADTDGRINGYEVRIVDPEGRDLAIGLAGEILVRGDGLFLGYTRHEATREAFTDDGWFRTGDLGVLDADDTITITGRSKDLIIRGGENISAKEIEDVLQAHPAIVEAAVVSAPHLRMGETVAAYLRTRGDQCPSPAELVEFVTRAGLARQKCPEHVRRLDEFPRTASGKIRKDVLRRMIRDDLSAPG
jgi:acyl-CoA synthetase (AMP-forming)/AMP-acid ligase II